MSKKSHSSLSKWHRVSENRVEPSTKVEFIGGVNKDRIGGNCMVIEHTNEALETKRVMFDLGCIFTPYESGFSTAYPDVGEYFDWIDPITKQEIKAKKPVAIICLTHVHEDHIGALMNYVRMGYELPPIKASAFTRSLICKAFLQMGMQPPFIEKINPGDKILVGKDIEIEPFSVSHSVVDALGFHTLTKINDQPYAGIINNGDFLVEENMPVGKSFSFEQYQDLLRRKLVTNVQIDSTSTVPNGKDRIGFEKAIENTYNVVKANPDRSLIISPVISRSVENMAIDIEVAKKLGTKVYLEGKWLQLVKQAMTDSGHLDFDKYVYSGTLEAYLNDKNIKTKYVIATGAFAQGLEEYNHNKSDLAHIPMAAVTKMALDLHQNIRIGKNVLVLARQRIIDDINGKTGPEMLQRLAAKGAKIVMTPSAHKVADFEEVQMQDSGHINAMALGRVVEIIKIYAPNAIYTPIHGNPEQCENTKRIIEAHGGKVVLAENQEIMNVSQNKTFNEPKLFEQLTWVGVKLVYQDPIHPNPNIPQEGITEFWRVDENYMPIEKLFAIENTPVSKEPYSSRYQSSSPNMLDDTMEEMLLESEPQHLSPKELKYGTQHSKRKHRKPGGESAGRMTKKEWKKAKAMQAIAAYQKSQEQNKLNNIQILKNKNSRGS